ncbi:copper chaperone PCu(A)C [Parahaliea aestuarii]|uniref:Copper chaperone PCu(A)C n=1 Tax=Parahaliea aestuarii TaxID=1852021 RepID=A0A5C8ZLV1_9GAMM|nr:copper chaperone PCu(A)C [Parahaliea aestuarii]TXS89453.1 copper chaperone PCu(A)C [Parahaliea aestuarii]
MRILPAIMAAALTTQYIPQAAAQLELSEAWVRALPPVQRNTAAYLHLSNTGESPVTVTGGNSPLAARVELHESTAADGMMRMRQLEVLTLAPGESLQLAPGGVHLMLLDLERMPAAGERVTLCLELAGGEEACTEAAVMRQAGGDHSHHH